MQCYRPSLVFKLLEAYSAWVSISVGCNNTCSNGPDAGEDHRHREPPAPGHAPQRQTAAARAGQLASPQPPFDLQNIATYHDHGCLHCTKQRPSRPAKERGGPLRSPECDQPVVAHEQGATGRQPP